MDPLLAGTVALIVLAVVMVAIAWRRWTNTTESFSRVEALRALVAESSRVAAPPVTAPTKADPPSSAVAAPAHQFVVTVPDAPSASPSQLSFQRTESGT